MTSRKARTGLAVAALACAVMIASPAVAQGLLGPGKFKVEQTDDRFSTSPTTMVIGHNNRVTKKSPAGGIYIGSQGLYLDPVIVRSRADGKIVQVGFVVENRTEIDTTFGSPNSLGSIQKVTFLVDGRLIPATVSASDQRFSDRIDYNTISRSASSALNESGMVFLQPADMATLATAQSVAIQIQGSSRSWTIENSDLSKSFLENIRTFYQQQVMPTR